MKLSVSKGELHKIIKLKILPGSLLTEKQDLSEETKNLSLTVAVEILGCQGTEFISQQKEFHNQESHSFL